MPKGLVPMAWGGSMIPLADFNKAFSIWRAKKGITPTDYGIVGFFPMVAYQKARSPAKAPVK